MRTNMIHQFNQVPKANIERSSFNRSHGYKTTFDAGYLVPFYVDEALPGDTFNLRLSAFARLATPIKAPMDNIFMDFFFFACPNRLLWNNWAHFMGEKDNPSDNTSYTVPYIVSPNVAGGGIAEGSLSDYMGLPTKPLNGGGATTGLQFNSLHHRMYNLTYNQWFRDQNLQNSVVVDLDDGPDTYTDYVLLRRGKRHDYFTSALPWPQKGPSVSLPLGTSATVKTSTATLLTGAQNAMSIRNAADGAVLGAGVLGVDGATSPLQRGPTSPGTLTGGVYPINLYADLTDATAATINALREAFQLQKLYERDARGGTRYVEVIKSHFGVTSPDHRMQRVEYLGGGSVRVNVHPVAQTSGTPVSGTPQGNLSGFGTASVSGVGFTKSFTEHCCLMGIVNVRADLSYQQGEERMWNRRTRFDYYWPALSHLGEQSILNREIYANLADGTGAAQKDGVFGYQERYAEYRYKPSKITGLFRSNASATLDSWHLAQNFTTQPTLNTTFIQDDPPIDRVIAVNTEPHFLFDSYIELNCARPMPVYSVPGLIDHF